nr:hypothetical protein [Gigaspora margarita]
MQIADKYDIEVGTMNLEKRLGHLNVSIDEFIYFIEEMKELGYPGKLPASELLSYIWDAKKELRKWDKQTTALVDPKELSREDLLKNFSVAEIQRFIKTTSRVKYYPWRTHILPGILSAEFLQVITDLIKNLKSAYSVLFIAQTTEGENSRFASLGHSVTITNKTNPKELYERLLSNHKFIQESHTITPVITGEAV